MSYIHEDKRDVIEPLIAPAGPEDGLTTAAIAGYSVGHVFNDLCAGVWFNFLLFYITKVVNLPPQITGFVMLSGQIADGLMTPLVGVCSDKTNTSCGKRTPWYLFGTALVAPSFFGLYWECIPCDIPALAYQSAQMVYYITLPALFNIGWASVQISNMSLIAQITLSKSRRDSLVGYRTAATYASNFLVLLIALFIFIMTDNSQLGFKILDVSVTSLGFLCALLYLILVPEVKYSKLARFHYCQGRLCSDSTRPQTYVEPPAVTWREWLSRSQVYIFGGVYMFSRLAINVFSSLTPFYLQDVLQMGGGKAGEAAVSFELALVPMIGYTFSSLSSLVLAKRHDKWSRSRFYPYFVGILLLSLGILPLLFLSPDFSWPIYMSAALIGTSFSHFLNTSINCIVSVNLSKNDVVGQNQESGAFVFGFFSFLDKMSNGIVLFYISTYGLTSPDLIRYETAMIAFVSAYMGMLLLYCGTKWYDLNRDESILESTSK